MINGRVIFYALLVALILSLPYIAGASAAPEGWAYSGAAAIPGGFQVDYNSHMAKMWQGARGAWDYHLLFTSEAHPGVFGVQLFYMALGAAAGALRMDFALAYHLARFGLTVVMILALWRLICLYFAPRQGRWTALVFTTLVMGWGWLLYFAAPLLSEPPQPIEFWLMDAYNLTGAFYMPHFSAAITLQIAAWLLFLRGLPAPNLRTTSALTGVLALLVLVQPYVVLITFPVFGLVALDALVLRGTKSLALLARVQRGVWLLIPALVHGGLAIYQYLALNAHPVWADFTAQNITLSPPPIYYLVGYAPFWIALVLGVLVMRAQHAAPLPETSIIRIPDTRWLLPVIWVMVVLVLLYAPLPTQRRYLLGWQTPLGLLAAWAWMRWLNRFAPRRRPLVALPFFAVSVLALILLLLGNLAALTPASTRAAYYTPDELAGYAWLRANAAPDDIVLTTLDGTGQGSGGRLVAMTGQRVYLGHWIETAHFLDKYAELARFYDPTTPDTWRADFLRASGVTLIWYDEYARALGTWSPEDATKLTPVFTTPTVVIYRIIE